MWQVDGVDETDVGVSERAAGVEMEARGVVKTVACCWASREFREREDVPRRRASHEAMLDDREQRAGTRWSSLSLSGGRPEPRGLAELVVSALLASQSDL